MAIKKETQIIIAGFGGQGVLFTGRVLIYAAAIEGNQVTWFPSYGGAMRGGTANCSVAVSPDEIGSPVISQPDVLIALNKPSLDKFMPVVKVNGLIIWNKSLINAQIFRKDIENVGIPANELAEKSGSQQVVNMVMLGAYIAISNLVSFSSLERSLEKVLSSGSKYNLLVVNKRALEAGRQWVGSVCC